MAHYVVCIRIRLLVGCLPGSLNKMQHKLKHSDYARQGPQRTVICKDRDEYNIYIYIYIYTAVVRRALVVTLSVHGK